MGRNKYPDAMSTVRITLKCGEIKEAVMSASHTIIHYIMEEARRTGVITIRNDKEFSSLSLPIENVLCVEVNPLKIEDVAS